MTRFARAKGSKSSNEKKPEEATSWLEMKKGMLSKPATAPEDENVEKNNVDPPSKTEWASLGDDGIDRYLSPNNNLLKKSSEEDRTNKISIKKKKKKGKVQLETENVNESTSVGNKKKNKKKTKLEVKSSQESEVSSKHNKKGKKRKINEIVEASSEVVKKKKQKKEEKIKNVKTIANNEKSMVVKNKKKLKKKKLSSDTNESVSPQKVPNKPTKNTSNKDSKNQNVVSKKKKVKNKPFKYDKTVVEELIVNGKTIPIVKFQGFNVMQEDAERLNDLRNEMLKQGIPKEKLEAALKLERRRAEKALSRLKKAVCFHCRGIGHLLSDCPNLKERENTGTGICYKCGSTEHLAVECKVVKGTNFAFAECFICKEQGHIARQCPDNPRGLYPQGGACRECGDVTHLRKDCPQVASKKSEEIFTVRRTTDGNLECLDEEIASKEKQKSKPVKKKSAVKF